MILKTKKWEQQNNNALILPSCLWAPAGRFLSPCWTFRFSLLTLAISWNSAFSPPTIMSACGCRIFNDVNLLILIINKLTCFYACNFSFYSLHCSFVTSFFSIIYHFFTCHLIKNEIYCAHAAQGWYLSISSRGRKSPLPERLKT